MIPPQSFVDVRRWWPEVSSQVGPLAVPSKRRQDQRHHRLMAASLQAKTFLGSPLYRDVGRRRAASVLVVSTAFVRAALGGRGLGNLPELHRNPHCHAQRDPSRVRAFRPVIRQGSGCSRTRCLGIRGPFAHQCGTALMLTIVEVVGRLNISNSDANQWALDKEGHRRKELRFMLDSPLQRLVVLRLVCEPLRHLLSAKYDLSSNAWEEKQRSSAFPYLVAVKAPASGGSWLVCVTNTLENKALENAQLLLECSSMWEVLPESSMRREDVLVSVFISLCPLGALVTELLIEPH